MALISRQEVAIRGLLAMLADYPGRIAVAALRDLDEQLHDIDVVLYDTLCLHRRDAEELDQLLATPGVSVLAYSRDMRPDLRGRALAKGCSAWVSMSASAEELVEAIERTAAGLDTKDTGRDREDPGLTAREVEILALITQGLSNQDITESLGLTANTLKTHIRQIYRKIGVTSRSQAVAWALQGGFVPAHRPDA